MERKRKTTNKKKRKEPVKVEDKFWCAPFPPNEVNQIIQ
jgi:hypothetical protein